MESGGKKVDWEGRVRKPVKSVVRKLRDKVESENWEKKKWSHKTERESRVVWIEKVEWDSR